MERGSHLVKVDLKTHIKWSPYTLTINSYWAFVEMVMSMKTVPCLFGICSAPKIFLAVTDAVAWSLFIWESQNPTSPPDDFLFFGRPQTVEVAHILDTVLGCLHQIGAPVALLKTEGPGTRVTFLGIFIDTELMELHIPEDKLHGSP